MNWQIIQNGAEWQVVDASGTVIATYGTREEALGRVRELVDQAMTEAFAEADSIDPDAAGARFEMEFLEGEQSVDNRIIDPEATQFNRPPPLPVMLMTELGPGGHEGARVCGVVDEVARDGNRIYLRGHFDSGSEAGQEAERLVSDGVMTWWSPDFSYDASIDIECTEEDEDGFCEAVLIHLTEATILGGTICPKQALTSARISILEAAASSSSDDDAEAASVTPITAAVEAPVRPPQEWFEDPGFSEATPLTVTDDGRVYGHAALWGTCHIGREDVCLTPPRSENGYASFMTGEVQPDGCDCDAVPVGQITLGTGHASLTADPHSAAAHYDNTGTAVADVASGEDAHGIWFAGALRPGVTEEQVRELRGAAISGDWRRIGGNLEMVAMLAVNVPGYPVPRTQARVAGGREMSLVAAGPKLTATSHAARPEADGNVTIQLTGAEAIVLRELLSEGRGTARDKLLDRIRV